ncbi:MAG: hypothetical protein ACLTZM_27050 [Ruminococcus sp.]
MGQSAGLKEKNTAEVWKNMLEMHFWLGGIVNKEKQNYMECRIEEYKFRNIKDIKVSDIDREAVSECERRASDCLLSFAYVQFFIQSSF